MARRPSVIGAVHRVLKVSQSPQSGRDVRKLQVAHNNRARARKLSTITVDSVFGKQTASGCADVLYALGALDHTVSLARRGTVTIGAQRMIRYPGTRSRAQLGRARERRGTGQVSDGAQARKGDFGIDWAWGRPDYGALRSAGVKFACRYLSFDSSKNLTKSQAKELDAHHIDCVVVWETTAARALSGRSAGVSDATAAIKQARECGMPLDGLAAIMFAVDFDATPSQQGLINAYFEGVHSVLDVAGPAHMPTPVPVGVYGSYYVCKRLFEAGLIDVAWQTYAWSGGLVLRTKALVRTITRRRVHESAALYQYSNGHRLAGVSCDYDRALADYFGQWRP